MTTIYDRSFCFQIASQTFDYCDPFRSMAIDSQAPESKTKGNKQKLLLYWTWKPYIFYHKNISSFRTAVFYVCSLTCCWEQNLLSIRSKLRTFNNFFSIIISVHPISQSGAYREITWAVTVFVCTPCQTAVSNHP